MEPIQYTGEVDEVLEKENKLTTEEQIEKLKGWLEHYVRQYRFSHFRKTRCELLMRRKSAKKWSQEKTAKMVRRLMVATKEIREAEETLDKIQADFLKLGIEVDVVSKQKTENLVA